MRNFQDEINLGSTHTTIPNKVPIPERPDVDRPRRKPLWRNPIAWIVAIMLPITIIAFLACTLFTPTVSKLNRRIRYKNFSVTVSGPGDSTELKIKGNVIAKDMGDGDYVYYEIEDGKLYRYVPYNTGWEKQECNAIITGQSADTDTPIVKTWAKLLSVFGYEPSKYEPFVWLLKDDVDVGGMEGVRLERKEGRFILTWTQDGHKYTAVFKGFLFTHFSVPSELKPLIYDN